MRGETMKDKSKKSTYSTTFGVDPKNQPIPQPLVLTRKLQIEGLGSMRRLSLKSTLFGVDPTYSAVLSTELINNLNGIKDLYKAHMTLYLTKPLGLCHARKSTYIKKRPLNAAAK